MNTTTLARRLQGTNDEPCESSCDATNDEECDRRDESGGYTQSCDLHPSTSCDGSCTYAPSPPLIPWPGNGTYPSPPPADASEDSGAARLGVALVLLALFFLCCTCLCVNYAQARRREGGYRDTIAVFCCCLLPWLKPDPHDDDFTDVQVGTTADADNNRSSVPKLNNLSI